jgi:hypothetical protein
MVAEQGEQAVRKQGKYMLKVGTDPRQMAVFSLSKSTLSQAVLSKAIRALL